MNLKDFEKAVKKIVTESVDNAVCECDGDCEMCESRKRRGWMQNVAPVVENSTNNVVKVTAENGVPFNVRLLNKGDEYGMYHDGKWALVWDKPEQGIEFYDARYDHSPYGQFVSRYYVAGIQDHAAETQGIKGINLHGSEPEWQIDGKSLLKALSMLGVLNLPELPEINEHVESFSIIENAFPVLVKFAEKFIKMTDGQVEFGKVENPAAGIYELTVLFPDPHAKVHFTLYEDLEDESYSIEGISSVLIDGQRYVTMLEEVTNSNYKLTFDGKLKKV